VRKDTAGNGGCEYISESPTKVKAFRFLVVGQIETANAGHSEAEPKNLAVTALRSEILRGVYTERSECAQDDNSRLAVKLTHYPPSGVVGPQGRASLCSFLGPAQIPLSVW